MSVTEVTSLSKFHEIINQDTPTVFDFWATWCGPCKLISPVFAKLAAEFPAIQFYKVDVDEQADIAQELDIRAMPTFLVFQSGNKVGESVGAVQDELTALIKKWSEPSAKSEAAPESK